MSDFIIAAKIDEIKTSDLAPRKRIWAQMEQFFNPEETENICTLTKTFSLLQFISKLLLLFSPLVFFMPCVHLLILHLSHDRNFGTWLFVCSQLASSYRGSLQRQKAAKPREPRVIDTRWSKYLPEAKCLISSS